MAAPNEWQKSAGGGRSAGGATDGGGRPSERELRYKAFWRDVIEDLKATDPSATTASPERAPRSNWYGISAGRPGFQDNVAFGWEDGGYILRAELYIDVEDKERNKLAFDRLLNDRESIESEVGETLIWTRRDDIRASRVYVKRPGSIEDADQVLSEYRVWCVEHLLAFRRAFGPRVRTLDLGS